ncbi:uncharacterized protein A4U43_C03F19250 [Asparagus officinalis]|uniref:Uncharacterized protein n=1 Tax=Asparagus officinalis TaxID=4686 RepID=A0A5P1FCA1_ASPOF|nr:uncharacterized protein A4U43_C03F19250 [Asparagus officinalis]
MLAPPDGETNSLSRTNITRARSLLLWAPVSASAAAINRCTSRSPCHRPPPPQSQAEAAVCPSALWWCSTAAYIIDAYFDICVVVADHRLNEPVEVISIGAERAPVDDRGPVVPPDVAVLVHGGGGATTGVLLVMVVVSFLH